jgi:hypothetical protein
MADRSGEFPRSLYVEDVALVQDRDSHRQGGFADVYRGTRGVESIAIKKPRTMDYSHIAHKVWVYCVHIIKHIYIFFRRNCAAKLWFGVTCNIQTFCRSLV